MNQAFYALAKQDIKASEVLFKAEMPLHSLYLLKQSVEKFWKALAVDLSFINEDKVKSEIGHSVIKIFLKFLSVELAQAPQVGNLISSDLEKLIQISFQDFEKFKNNNFQLSSIDQQNLIHLIANPENSNRFINAIFGNIDNSEQLMKILELTGLLNEHKNLFENEDFTSYMLDKIKEMMKMMPYLLMALSCLLHVAILLSSVKEDIRYPLLGKVSNPETIYNSEHVVIVSMPQLLHHVLVAFDNIDIYYRFKNDA